MHVEIRCEPFDPWHELEAWQRRRFPEPGAFGATCAFVGTMRDFNEGEAVRAMTLEHYPGMTERHLEAIAAQGSRRWGLLECLLIHRVGELQPGQPIVLVATWSAHRAAAFDACRALMEDLKSKAPFWKKERLPEGSRWVEHNTPG